MRQRSDSLKANLCQAQQRNLKTIAPLSHRPIVLTDTIDYRTIVFLHYRPNPIGMIRPKSFKDVIFVSRIQYFVNHL